MRIKPKSENEDQSNIFWITMTDLMTALVLVFIVLFFYTYATSYYEKIQRSAEQQKAATALQQSLEKQNITAQIDSVTGVVKISDLELFDVNSYELSPKGRAYLSKFAPSYLDSIFSNEYLNENIDKIIIQGHTDSQTYRGVFSDDEQYMKNMELSLKRAYAVANYMTNTPYNKVNGNRLRKMIVVEGASYSNPVMTNGKEDYAKSRRVELKVIMKEKNEFRESLKKAEIEAGEKIDVIEHKEGIPSNAAPVKKTVDTKKSEITNEQNLQPVNIESETNVSDDDDMVLPSNKGLW